MHSQETKRTYRDRRQRDHAESGDKEIRQSQETKRACRVRRQREHAE